MSSSTLEPSVRHDLREGTAIEQGGRQLYVCDDVLSGIHEALTYEAGEAAGLILYECGRAWGQRLWGQAKADDRDLGELTVPEWCSWVSTWFASRGWGRLQVDLQHAPSHGFVSVRIQGSPLPRLFGTEASSFADHLLVGLLEAQFCQLSGQPLRAIEIGCVGRGDAECTIVISGAQRIDQLEELFDDGGSVDEAYALLLEPSR